MFYFGTGSASLRSQTLCTNGAIDVFEMQAACPDIGELQRLDVGTVQGTRPPPISFSVESVSVSDGHDGHVAEGPALTLFDRRLPGI